MYRRKGSRYWHTRIGGIPVSLRTEIEADAEELERTLKQQHWREKYLGLKPLKSWQEACVQWGKENDGKITWKDDVRAIKFWSRYFLNLRDIREISREKADEIIQENFEIAKEPSSQNNTANHYVGYLSAILHAACRKWDWIERAPLLRRYPAPDGRKRILTPNEWRGLESSLPTLRLPATFALATGVRRGKQVSAEWPQFDMRNRSFSFDGTANKLGNTIPLNDTAMAVLQEIQASPVRHMTYVFTKEGKPLPGYIREWYAALDDLGLRGVEGQEDFCWHSLRHTFATWLRQHGTPTWALNRLGGWSNGGMVNRYAHAEIESLRPYSAIIDHVLNGEENVLLSKRG